jgi:hypothetical protein
MFGLLPAQKARERTSARRPRAIRRPVPEFEPETPRAALAALAVAIAVVTMVALVLVPAALDSVAQTLY